MALIRTPGSGGRRLVHTRTLDFHSTVPGVEAKGTAQEDSGGGPQRAAGE